MPRLPSELVREILQFLDHQRDLRLAAAVSRAFYASAWRAGLLLYRRLLWEQDKSSAAELTTLSEVVRHARTKNLRLSLTLILRTSGRTDSQTNSSASGPPYSEVICLIPIALPVLDSLCLSVSDPMIASIAGGLCRPAPHLRSLNLTVDTDGSIPEYDVPADIFTGVAPKLRSITLYNLRLGHNTVAAFAHIRSVQLGHRANCQEIVISPHFPALRSLSLCLTTSQAAGVPYNIHGVSLEELELEDSSPPTLLPAFLCGDNPIDVPILRYACMNVQWMEPLWRRPNDGPISVRVTPYSSSDPEVSVIVVPEHRRWYREYNLYEWHPDWPFPAADLPRLTERLTYLRMDNLYIISFLECANLAFHALREMQIDFYSQGAHSLMVWPPDWIDAFADCAFTFGKEDGSTQTFEKESYRSVDCTKLRTLRLFAANQEMSVASLEVAYLGRALSQCLRRKQDRAALELHGMNIHEDTAHALLDEAFSAVHLYNFRGLDGPLDRDSGLWDNYNIV